MTAFMFAIITACMFAIGSAAMAAVPAARTAFAAGDCKAAGDAINEGLGRNDAEAFFFAGLMYDLGNCVDADAARAARLYRRAIELGDDDASSNLAMLYASGRGVSQDYAMAHRVLHGGKPVAGDADASADELIALGYAETLARTASREVAYPASANGKSIEASMDVIVTPGADGIDLVAVHVGVESGSNVARPHDFTDQIDTAYRQAIARLPRPRSAASSIRIATPWIFRMPRTVDNRKTRLEGVVDIGDSRVVH